VAERTQDLPKFCRIVDKYIGGIGRVTAWLSFVLMLVIIVQVVLRYVFGQGLVVLEELEWHLFAAMIMIGVSAAVVSDNNIRLDLLHRGFSKRTQAIIEVLGIIILLLPMVVVIFLHSLDFLADAWRVGERSDAPTGLCCRWVIKAFIPIGMILLAGAGVSRLIRTFLSLKKT